MAHPDLTSHHVNYLIWRYLQESGHADAAVLLQRAWNHDPQSLPFAPYIRTHALVSLVQKGLQYHELEQSFDKEGTPISYTPDSFFFGPPSLDPSSPTRPSIATAHVDASAPPVVADRRRQPSVSPSAAKLGSRDSVAINGHLTSDTTTTGSGKKTRKGDRTTAEPPTNGDGMDIDSNGTFTGPPPPPPPPPPPHHHRQHESPSATAPVPDADVDGDGDVSMGAVAAATTRSESQGHEPSAPKSTTTTTTSTSSTTTGTVTNLQPPPPPPPLPPTLITGHSVGVQITPAKAADLSPDTAVLDVAQDDHVTRTLWRPHDPTVVVAAGDTFCSLWRLPSSSQASQSSPPAPEKLVESSGDNTCVSAVAWNPTGQKLAVATYNDMRGSITMYDVQGNAVDLLPEVPRMITGLHWSESSSNSSHLVVVASDSRQSELALWDDSLRPEEFPAPQVVDGSIYDLSWLGHSQAFACGDGSVYQCQIDSSIHISKTYNHNNNNNNNPSGDTDPDTTWTFIRCASVGPAKTPLAVAASSASASFWIPTHDMHHENAHQADITAIELRAPAQSPAILASCSIDDTVKVWQIDPDTKRFDCIHRLHLGPSVPALVGTFSPDGYALAAGSKDNLYIWNAERGGAPLATWKVPRTAKDELDDRPVNGKKSGSPEPLPDRSLSWDTDGKRLAFGVGRQMAIVNLQR